MSDNGRPLAIVPPENALAVADLFATAAEMCIKLEVDGANRNTGFSYRGMGYFEAWAIAEEIALACRLARMTGWKDPREEIDTLGLETEAKVCVTYHGHRQALNWMRKNLSYQDAELAAMVVSRMCQEQLFPPGSIA